jgi:hypothetical protein
MRPAVRVRFAALLLTTASAWLTSACAPAAPPVNTPTVNTGIDCASYGGCDVLEDFTDGSAAIIPLRSMTFYDADMRARTDAKRADVRDASVVGHDAPHVGLSNLYYRTPSPT